MKKNKNIFILCIICLLIPINAIAAPPHDKIIKTDSDKDGKCEY